MKSLYEMRGAAALLAALVLLLSACGARIPDGAQPEPTPQAGVEAPAAPAEAEVPTEPSEPGIPTVVLYLHQDMDISLETAEYPSKAALLEAFEFSGQPSYRYEDETGNLQLELWVDAERGRCCGLRYDQPEQDGDEPVSNGFVGNIPYTREWDKDLPAGEDVDFSSQVYSLKGELLYAGPVYDQAGRLRFARSYITHGHYEHYYLYADEGETPAYYLRLDWNHGYYNPELTAIQPEAGG